MAHNVSNSQAQDATITKALRQVLRGQRLFLLRTKGNNTTSECRRLIGEIESRIGQCTNLDVQSEAIDELGAVQRRLTAVLRDLPRPKKRK
jgi:hypothetical protein